MVAKRREITCFVTSSFDSVDTKIYADSNNDMINWGQACLHRVMSNSFSPGTSHYSSAQPCIR